MQKNPKEVMQKYGNNLEFQELLKEFGKIMGSHFEELAKKQEQPSTQEQKDIEQQKKLQEMLDSDKEVKVWSVY